MPNRVHSRRSSGNDGTVTKECRVLRWEDSLTRYPAVTSELPGVLGVLGRYLEPLAPAVPVDWLELAAVAAWSALWPSVRADNLSVQLWFVGVGGGALAQPLTDEVVAVTEAAATTAGLDLAAAPLGGPRELVAALAGTARAALLYYPDPSALLVQLRDDRIGKAALAALAQGRDVVLPGAGAARSPRAALLLTCAASALIAAHERADYVSGWLGECLMCAPNLRLRQPEDFPAQDERAAMAAVLAERVTALRGVQQVAWEGGRSARLAAYAKAVGVDTAAEVPLGVDHAEQPSGALVVNRAKRVAALLALAGDNPQLAGGTLLVAERDVEVAVRLVARAAAYSRRVADQLGMTKADRAIEKTLHVLKLKGEVTRREILQSTRLTEKEANEALRLLYQDGQVVNRQEGRKELWRLVRRDDD